MTQYDAVVVGAGIIGLATAYHIQQKNPQDKILVIDKMPAAGQGNTSKSAAMFRISFSSPTNLTLVRTSTKFYDEVQRQGTDLKIRRTGYLWLFNGDKYNELEPVLEEMKKNGLEYTLFDPDELEKKIKINTKVSQDEESQMMGLTDVHKGVLVPNAGSIGVDSLVKFYELGFRKLSGEISYNTEAYGITVESDTPLGISGEPYFWQKPKITGVKTNKGEIKAKKTIIAAGAWVSSLLRPIGIPTYVEPIKRQIFSIKANTQELKELLHVEGLNPVNCLPFTILTNGLYIKPALEEDAFWLCYSDGFPRGFNLEDNPQSEENFYNYGIHQVVTKYFPQFKNAQLYTSFAGLYALNTLDKQPVIFEQNGLIVVGGLSGSGIMKADSMGRIATALYNGEETAMLFGDEQFKVSDLSLKNRKVVPEKMVI